MVKCVPSHEMLQQHQDCSLLYLTNYGVQQDSMLYGWLCVSTFWFLCQGMYCIRTPTIWVSIFWNETICMLDPTEAKATHLKGMMLERLLCIRILHGTNVPPNEWAVIPVRCIAIVGLLCCKCDIRG